ncbi:hypothetical protein [Methylomonas sp. AM2-LC]|uniref:hypothetical protein n=1 Tax=Methylomonas sp. AM2-LC TaxID=3153301 RepID=UPI0032660B9E
MIFAKNLPDDIEINLRNAISRAYYAAYHSCLGKIEVDKTVKGGVHQKLITSLKKTPNSKAKELGYALEVLKRNRTIGVDFKKLCSTRFFV